MKRIGETTVAKMDWLAEAQRYGEVLCEFDSKKWKTQIRCGSWGDFTIYVWGQARTQDAAMQCAIEKAQKFGPLWEMND